MGVLSLHCFRSRFPCPSRPQQDKGTAPLLCFLATQGVFVLGHPPQFKTYICLGQALTGRTNPHNLRELSGGPTGSSQLLHYFPGCHASNHTYATQPTISWGLRLLSANLLHHTRAVPINLLPTGLFLLPTGTSKHIP